MKKLFYMVAGSFVLLMTGCSVNLVQPLVNNYDGIDPRRIIADSTFIFESQYPNVKSSCDFMSDHRELMRLGYYPVGTSNFYGCSVDRKSLLIFGTRYHASYVLHQSFLAASVPNTISPPSGYGSAPYNAGAAAGYGLAQSLIYLTRGTSTNYYNNIIGIYIKRKLDRLCIFCVDIPHDMRDRFDYSGGVLIDVIRLDFKRYAPKLIEGDVVLKVDDVDIYDLDHFYSLFSMLDSGTHIFRISRYGTIKDIEVDLSEM